MSRNVFLGVLHDIAYEIDSDVFGHDIVGADILSKCGYKYANEIRYHSCYQSEYDTLEMRLLYYGDQVVDGQGNWCTVDERLEDIKTRYGEDSRAYAETLEIVKKLKEWGMEG